MASPLRESCKTILLGVKAHKHDCGHWCFCHLFPDHSPNCQKCRRDNFQKYIAGLAK